MAQTPVFVWDRMQGFRARYFLVSFTHLGWLGVLTGQSQWSRTPFFGWISYQNLGISVSWVHLHFLEGGGSRIEGRGSRVEGRG